MTAADKVTSLRLILAPVFFILYLLPQTNIYGFKNSPRLMAILWILFLVIELSDLLDGRIARSRNEVGDFGKLFDPFADTLVRITYFLCFVITGILPVIPFLVILYREFGILFLRVLMMKKGIAMGARWGGKIKAVSYMITGVACLCSVTADCLGFDSLVTPLRLTAYIIFLVSMGISVISFIDYVFVYQRARK